LTARPLIALGSLVCLAAPARASVPEMFGMGARSSALAATGVADAEGYDASYINPAGVVGPTHRRLTVGYILARYRLRMDGAPRKVDDTDGILIGAAIPLPFGGVLENRLALGFAFYFPVGEVTRARDPFPGEPRLALLDNRTGTVSITVAAAARVHARVSLGIGVLALAALVGNIAIAPDASGRFTTVSEEQLVTSYAPVAGLRVQAARWLKLGAALRGESKSEYDLRVTNSLGSRLPIGLPTLRLAGVAQFDPLQIAVEGAFRPHPSITVEAGVTWKHWSAYTNPVVNATPGAPPQPDPGFHDTAVPRLALEVLGQWGCLQVAGRAGYFFEWSPSPSNAPALLDADRHVVTAGGGLAWRNRLTALALEVFGQFHQLTGNPRATGYFGVFGVSLGLDL
jgi:long-subunit fatty acid transport protein